MFYRNNINENIPGFYSELKVSNVLEQFFDSSDTIGHQQFNLFLDADNSDHKYKREIDILMIDKLKGITVVEVKGIKINQIESINGNVWKCKGFYTNEISPYKQAERQMNKLIKGMKKNIGYNDELPCRAIVALPEIRKEDWIKRGFHRLPNNPPIIFQDDLKSKEKIQNILRFSVSNSKGLLTEQVWKDICVYFGVSCVGVSSKEIPLYSFDGIAYSKLYMFVSPNEFMRKKSEIEIALIKGTKVYIFVFFQLENTWKDYKFFYKKYIEANQLNIYETQKKLKQGLQNNIEVIDGNNFSENKYDRLLAHYFSMFNVEQYQITHYGGKKDMFVTAGAGTGKTFVMVERIVYLIITGQAKLSDIDMITFTNNSKEDMKEKLISKFITLYELTHDSKFLIVSENIQDLTICTIDSYAKKLLQELAHEFGYGKNIKVENLIYEKKETIGRLIDRYNAERTIIKPSEKPLLEHYELVNHIFSLWDVIESRGYNLKIIAESDWGFAEDNGGTLMDLIKFVLSEAEDNLKIIKEKNSSMTINDLVKNISSISKNSKKMSQLTLNKFLFIDEFQDSSDLQIQLAANLKKLLQYKLFIVGDIKQSIYRFRGADYKAFDELKKLLLPDVPLEKTLRLNYRTSEAVLNEIDKIFCKWSEEYLPYEEKDRLVATKLKNTSDPKKTHLVKYCFKKGRKNNEVIEPKLVEQIKYYLEKYEKEIPNSLVEMADKEKATIGIIVRTNREAEMVKEILRNNNIGSVEQLKGTFYQTDSVKHVFEMINGLLYLDNAKSLLKCLQTPFFGYLFTPASLIPFDGDNDEIVGFANQQTDKVIPNIVKQMKEKTPLTVINEIISKEGLYKNIFSYYRMHGYEEIDCIGLSKQYIKNLYHILNIIEKTFGEDFISLYNISEFLNINIRTNNHEDVPLVDHSENNIVITTVHSAKGLEYDTVIMPFVTYVGNRINEIIYIEQTIPNKEIADELYECKIGWGINTSNENKESYKNNYFNRLVEMDDEELMKEECRLLYVAMTRAKENLVIFLPNNNDKYSWGNLLTLGGVERWHAK